MIGVFGGTFDPPHLGHIHLSLALRERAALEEVWVVPAAISPLRTDTHPARPHHRLEMTKRAFDTLPGFSVLDLEITQPGPSYTIDTLKKLLEKHPKLALLMGADAFASFEKWKDYQHIADLVPLLIGARPGTGTTFSFHHPHVTFFPIPELAIDATTIRDRLKKKLPCEHLLPEKVLDYIHENQVYSSLEQ